MTHFHLFQCKAKKSSEILCSGIHGPKAVGPRLSGSVLVLGPDHQKFETKPGPTIFRKSRIDSVRLVPGPDEPWIPDYVIKAIDLP